MMLSPAASEELNSACETDQPARRATPAEPELSRSCCLLLSPKHSTKIRMVGTIQSELLQEQHTDCITLQDKFVNRFARTQPGQSSSSTASTFSADKTGYALPLGKGIEKMPMPEFTVPDVQDVSSATRTWWWPELQADIVLS